jgi:hypothetical protein
MERGDQYGFVASPGEIIVFPYKKSNFNGRVDIDFDECKRVVFLDVPMVNGKSFVAEEHIKGIDPKKTVLSVTFRISVAKYLATRLSLDSYLDSGIWEKTDEATNKKDRLAVCLDSIYKIIKSSYVVIFLDEGTFIQYHFVPGVVHSMIFRYLSFCFKLLCIYVSHILTLFFIYLLNLTEVNISVYLNNFILA